MQWASIIKGFQAYLKLERSVSANTSAAYLRDVALLESFLESELGGKSLNQVDFSDLKEFITKRVNEKLAELGYNPIKGGDDYFEFNEKKASELDWFYHLTGGVTHTDFFAMRPTDYSKAGEGENWDDIF